MKKFRFRLEMVLRVAVREEQRLTLELSRLKMEQQTAQRWLVRLLEGRGRERLRLMEAAQGAVDLEKIKILRSHLDFLAEKINAQRAFLAALEPKVLAKMAEVTAAMKKRKTLERLKERQIQEYQLEVLRQEAKFLDDTTTPRHALRKQINTPA
jgi:flagellar protein FliJ